MRFLFTVWLTAGVIVANPILGSLSTISFQAINPTDAVASPTGSQSEDSVSAKSSTATSLSTATHNSFHLRGRDLKTQDDFNKLKKDITTFVLPAVNTYIDAPDKETADGALAQVTSIYKNAQKALDKGKVTENTCDALQATSANLPMRISCIYTTLDVLQKEIQLNIAENLCQIEGVESILQKLNSLYNDLPTDTMSSLSASGTAMSTISYPLCDGSCSACVATSVPFSSFKPRKARAEKQTTALNKRAVLTPAQFGGDMLTFILNLWDQSHIVPHPLDHVLQKGIPSGDFQFLQEKVYSMGVDDLYGCTAVVIVSQMGVWMSHFFESPAFSLRNPVTNMVYQAPDSYLDEEVLIPMAYGGQSIVGILDFIQSGAFQSRYDAAAFIITPPGPTTETVEYPRAVSRISSLLHNWMPSSPPPQIISYTRVNPLTKSAAEEAKGMVFVQYDPSDDGLRRAAGTSAQVASLKIWVEDRSSPVYETSWMAYPFQLVNA